MSKLSNKEAAILSQLVYTNEFFDNRDQASNLRGQTLHDIFFTNGSVDKSIVTDNVLADNLTNNFEHYKNVLNKYQLVETTSTIVDGGGVPIEYNLLGDNSYSGTVVTEVLNPSNTVFVSRGTDSKVDVAQDVVMAAGFMPEYMQDAHQFYHDVLEAA